MSKDTLNHRIVLALGIVFINLVLLLALSGCGQEPTGSGQEQEGAVPDRDGPVQEQKDPLREQPSDQPSSPEQPHPKQPALPRDSMVEAMLRIQLAEAYRARYYVLHAGAAAEPPLMDSLYALALAPLGISTARYEAAYRQLLDRDPIQLQALYDSCESILQRRLIGLR